MAAVSEEDMPGLVGLDASSVHASSGLNAAVRLNASVPAPSGFLVGLPAPSVPAVGGLNTSLAAPRPDAAAKKIAAQKLQKERDAVSANAIAQMSVLASQRAATDADAKEKAIVNALTLDAAPPNASSSGVWVNFRKYSVHKREEFAVCLCCKECGKSNWDSEVKYGASHSTSKLLQHIASCHKEEHKRKLESVVEEQRKAGTTLLAALNVSSGVTAVDNYVEWIALGCLPLLICEDKYFREMVYSLNPKSPLNTLSARTATEKVLFTYMTPLCI